MVMDDLLESMPIWWENRIQSGLMTANDWRILRQRVKQFALDPDWHRMKKNYPRVSAVRPNPGVVVAFRRAPF